MVVRIHENLSSTTFDSFSLQVVPMLPVPMSRRVVGITQVTSPGSPAGNIGVGQGGEKGD
jgi:hypothetical protein